jgi:hypothetical protein
MLTLFKLSCSIQSFLTCKIQIACLRHYFTAQNLACHVFANVHYTAVALHLLLIIKQTPDKYTTAAYFLIKQKD